MIIGRKKKKDFFILFFVDGYDLFKVILVN